MAGQRTSWKRTITPIDRSWEDYPRGTQAMARSGGYWTKSRKGWKWSGQNGAVFDVPGRDVIGVRLPQAKQLPGVSLHARSRAAERYGQDFPDSAWLAAWRSIVEGSAVLVRSYLQRGNVYAVRMPGEQRPVPVVYDANTAMIITVLKGSGADS